MMLSATQNCDNILALLLLCAGSTQVCIMFISGFFFAETPDCIATKQAAQAGEEAAKRAEQSEDQKKLISGLQQEHTSQAHAMDLQASAALRLVCVSTRSTDPPAELVPFLQD